MATALPPLQISSAEAAYLSGGIVSGIRGDGRGAADVRSIAIATGVLPSASGSGEARMAGAHVMVGVKVELEPPLPSSPDRGTVAVTVEVSPCAGPQWFGRVGEERAAEVAAALSSSLGSGGGGGGGGGGGAGPSTSSSLPPALDLRSLCVARGVAAWHLRIQCLLLSLDGTSATLTAASAAVAAALADTRVPAVTVVGGAAMADDDGGGDGGDGSDDEEAAPPEIEVEDDLSKATAVDASRVPVFVTVALASSGVAASSSAAAAAGDNSKASSSNSSTSAAVPVVAPFSAAVVGLAADPDAAEEAASRSSVSVAVDAAGATRASFVSYCGSGSGSGGRGGSGGMSFAQLSAALALARSVGSGIAREVADVSKEAIVAATA